MKLVWVAIPTMGGAALGFEVLKTAAHASATVALVGIVAFAGAAYLLARRLSAPGSHAAAKSLAFLSLPWAASGVCLVFLPSLFRNAALASALVAAVWLTTVSLCVIILVRRYADSGRSQPV